jgi:hypothetical protein
MRRSVVITLVILCLMVLGCEQAGKGKVSGRVVDGQGTPLADVIVTSDVGDFSTTTDASGEYTFTDIPTGRYTFTATYGSDSGEIGVSVKEGSSLSCTPEPIEVTAGDIEITITMLPDTVAITSPIDGATVNGAVNVTVTAGSDIDKVVFYIDDVEKSTDTASPFIYAWDTLLEVNNSSYTLKAAGFDSDGVQLNEDEITVTVSNVDSAPTAGIVSPTDGADVSGLTTISGTADDAIGVSEVVFYVDDVVVSTDTTSPYTYDWDTTLESEGACTIKIVAYDTISQTAEDQISVQVNNVDDPPTAGIVYPAEGAGVVSIVTISGTAADDNGVDRAVFYIDDVEESTDTVSPFTYDWDSTAVIDGPHTIKMRAFDTTDQTGEDQISINVFNSGIFSDDFEGWSAPAIGSWSSKQQIGAGDVIDTTTTIYNAGAQGFYCKDTTLVAYDSPYLQKDLTPATEFYFRVYMYLPTGFDVAPNNTIYTLVIYTNTDKRLLIAVKSDTLVPWLEEGIGWGGVRNTAALSLNTWHCVELLAPVPSASSQVRWWIDDVERTALTANLGSESTWNYVRLGVVLEGGSDGTPLKELFFDDFAVDVSRIGP